MKPELHSGFKVSQNKQDSVWGGQQVKELLVPYLENCRATLRLAELDLKELSPLFQIISPEVAAFGRSSSIGED